MTYDPAAAFTNAKLALTELEASSYWAKAKTVPATHLFKSHEALERTITELTLSPVPASGGSLGAIFLDAKEVPLAALHRYDWLGVQSWMRDRIDIAKLRAAGTRVYAYLETAGYRDDATLPHPTSIPAANVQASWKLEPTFWGGSLHLLDIGNQAYQDAWASWAIKDMAGVFDGVLMDDVNTGLNFRSAWSSIPAGYDTDAKWNTAVESFLARVCPQLHAAGLATVPNVGSQWNDDQAMLVRWAKLAGGFHKEHWLKWKEQTGVFDQAGWNWLTGLQRAVVGAGVPFYASTHGLLADTAAMRFCRASYLLFHEPTVGGAYSWLTWETADGGKDPWNPTWTVELGPPSGPAVQSGTVWTRQFQAGLVSVDTATGTAAFV